MKIESKVNPAATGKAAQTIEHVISDSEIDIEIVLYSAVGDIKPNSFGLYIWSLPFYKEVDILKDAIQQITGAEVESVSYFAGNGHGEVNVKYKESYCEKYAKIAEDEAASALKIIQSPPKELNDSDLDIYRDRFEVSTRIAKAIREMKS